MKCFLSGAVCVFTVLEAAGCYRSQQTAGEPVSDTVDTESAMDSSSEVLDTGHWVPDTEFETETDTATDACGLSQYTHPPDAETTCVLQQVDLSNDGSINQVFLDVSDASNGVVLYTDRDENGDGDWDHRTVYTYDAAGQRQSEASDMYVDGSFENLVLFRYNGVGMMVEAERDVNFDCTVDFRTTYRYDEAGVFLQTVTVSRPNDVVLRIDTYTYDAAGRLIRKDRDQNGDGSISARTHYTYDDNDNIVVLVQDSGTDDSVFSRQFYYYDSAGLRTRMDEDAGDGVILYSSVYAYDGIGRLLTLDRWYKNELSERIAYTYEPGSDRLILVETLRGENLFVEETLRIFYECPVGQSDFSSGEDLHEPFYVVSG